MPNPIEIDPEESPHHRFTFEMRRHRLREGWTQGQLARRLRMSPSKIGNIETSYRHADERLAQALDRVFGLNGFFHELWRDTRPQAPEHYRDFAIAEQRADEVHSWNPLLIPGLFQIEPYARQIFRGAPAITPEEIEQRLRNRMRRQVVLTRQDGPMVLSLIDEGALHRPLGDADMMREQLGHLLKVAEHPRVTIQVVPYSAYSTTGLQAAFSIAVSCGSASTVYLESPPRGRTVGDRDMISTLLRYFNVIRAEALPERQSISKIKEVMDGWI
ncbi:MAG TPA: helix-turn-helix transcriptional regulator [Thermopolyspora sp.]|jgi:Helix-turn-helix.